MNSLRSLFFPNLRLLANYSKNYAAISNNSLSRYYCEQSPKVTIEKSVNNVVLLGRVGINPQLRGTEAKPVVVFTLATNTNYKYESGEIIQKTDWHRISVFKPHLRNVVLEHLKKGARVYLEGRILYGEFTDTKGVIHNTTTIVANDVVFVGAPKKEEDLSEEMEDSL